MTSTDETADATDDLGTPYLRFERVGSVGWCTVDRPDARNALTSAMYLGVRRAVDLVNSDPELAALAITGMGDVFIPGGEMSGRHDDGNQELIDAMGVDVLPFRTIRNSRAHAGVAHARDLLMSGRRVDADEACRMGLVSRVVLHDDLQRATLEAVGELLRAAPDARSRVKAIINSRYGVIDDITFHASLESDEIVEGFRAFTEKRAPNWVPEEFQSGGRL